MNLFSLRLKGKRGRNKYRKYQILRVKTSFKVSEQLKEERETQSIIQQAAAITCTTKKYVSLMFPGPGFHFTSFYELNHVL